ncbi:collagen alpha-1(XXVIII) chain-like [Bombyx mandarina]|uniref:Collagen alpha-1(XXVIII) chain-like n=1 Tax=Bombyx mandarina TaxID=7092 RepID=A0A6J2KHG0_BOMMA|nr:collagen alpha-1(XXVIII) chain-like [Bombyx mandarina]
MFVVLWLLLVAAVSGEKFRFPDEQSSASLRIDTKVKFIDSRGDDVRSHREPKVQADEIPFREPEETGGFYNRPQGEGRYPVRVEEHAQSPYRVQSQAVLTVDVPKNYDSDGTLDSLQYCKCVDTPDCNPRPDSARACGSGKYLCCYKRKQSNRVNSYPSEYFNEVEDERPMLLPGQQNLARPFPPPPASEANGVFGPGHAHQVGLLGPFDRPQGFLVGSQNPTGNIGNSGVLVGPGGPTGSIGPKRDQNQGVLVGPDGPTGVIGPGHSHQGVLVGPDGPRDVGFSESAQRGVLVGPGGPTGIIGPGRNYGRRPVLTGPGGPTGIIGPGRNGRRGVLVGPGGPTGYIGPGFGRQGSPGVLVGPGGPTGTIGPGRSILVGPGGPTGQIGPQYFN